MNNNTLKEKINDYGNNIVAISLDFLKHKSTEEQRNEDYKLAGEILVKDIETLIQQAKEERDKEIVEMINKEIEKEKSAKPANKKEEMFEFGFVVGLTQIINQISNTK